MPSTPMSGMTELQGYSDIIVSVVTGHMGGSSGGYGMDEHRFSRVQREELRAIAKKLADEGRVRPSADDILKELSDNFSNKSAQIVNERIASIIYDWHVQALEDRKSFNAPDNPISIFNQLCLSFAVDFELPPLTNIRRPYLARLMDREGFKVDWQELSSGEQVIFRIICWLFYYKTTNHLYPRLLLLDEPDAHLTPRMTRRFLDHLYEVIHARLGIAVIMTTHSPNTVALSEERSLYELVRLGGGRRELVKTSRREALAKLSEGLLFVQEDTRLVFVEGIDDVPFYEKFYATAIAHYELPNAPSLKFISASTANPDSGGCTRVIETIARFKSTSIESLVCGVIDHDENNKPDRNLWVLPRYSIENYLYDPVIILHTLVLQGKQATLKSLKTIRTGDWRQLVGSLDVLQRAVNELVSMLEDTGGANVADDSDDRALVDSSWHFDGSREATVVQIPRWLETVRGKTLLGKVIHSPSSAIKNYVTAANQWLAIETTLALPVQVFRVYEGVRLGAWVN
jgi:hypothetical protein